MTMILKAVAKAIYELLLDANPYDQARKQQAYQIAEIGLAA